MPPPAAVPAAVPSAVAVALVVLFAVRARFPPAETDAVPAISATAVVVSDELATPASTPVLPAALAAAFSVIVAVEVAAMVTLPPPETTELPAIAIVALVPAFTVARFAPATPLPLVV